MNGSDTKTRYTLSEQPGFAATQKPLSLNPALSVARCILTMLIWPDTNINSAGTSQSLNEHSTAGIISYSIYTTCILPTRNIHLSVSAVKPV
jgi:hypothetical protein